VIGPMWVGLDFHKASCIATLVDDRGTEHRRWTFATSGAELERFALALPEGATVALEASTVDKPATAPAPTASPSTLAIPVRSTPSRPPTSRPMRGTAPISLS
jgi:hypothetical protein